ncbi:hypothetical protein I6F15_04505 [Bradyrhizobium sp. BRP14]|nr:hypothetical protein [Bradyrhizobium sp. BRP14]
MTDCKQKRIVPNGASLISHRMRVAGEALLIAAGMPAKQKQGQLTFKQWTALHPDFYIQSLLVMTTLSGFVQSATIVTRSTQVRRRLKKSVSRSPDGGV